MRVMHQCTRFGINAFNYVNVDRAAAGLGAFPAEGGQMHLIIQVTASEDAEMLVKTLQPLALQRQGEVVDDAWQTARWTRSRSGARRRAIWACWWAWAPTSRK